MLKLIPFLLIIFISSNLVAQQSSKDSSQTSTDSEYPYAFPILGKKATARGYQLPKPHGVMLNFLAGTQQLSITDMKVGFNNNGLIDVSEFVQFGPSKGTIYTLNVRLDTWILPFLNIGGYYGRGETQSEVSLVKPFELTTMPRSDAEYYGFSTLLAGAYNGFGTRFMATWDLNASWTTNENLDKPVFVAISGIRTGPIIPLKKPNKNFVIWVGGAYTYVAAETVGSIGGKEIFPGAGESIDEKQQQLDDWYNGLDNPGLVADKIYQDLTDVLTEIKGDIDGSSIQYSMTKKALGPVNLVLGIQHQFNLNWQLRGEVQILGGRTTGLLSLNYRFGL